MGKDNRKSTAMEFIIKAKAVHGDKYDYSNVVYSTAKKPLDIVCPLHGMFHQNANNHLSGNGCPTCGKTGFNNAGPAILYYLKVEHMGHTAYKIGITNRTVAQRYNAADLAKITVLSETKYELGELARQEETSIKREFKQCQWKGVDLLTDGNTELFDRDILELDTRGMNE